MVIAMNKHSPGPWFFYDSPKDLGELELCSNIEADGRCIAQVNARSGLSKERNVANGRLMAAAPELAESLQELIQLVALQGRTSNTVATHINKALALLARANGTDSADE